MIAGDLTREIGGAGVGVARLIRFDPRWSEGFDPSAGGFLRSFAGPLLALPFLAVVAALISAVAPNATGVDGRMVWGTLAAQMIDMVAFPAVIAALARPLGFGDGFGAYIVVINWLTLYISLASAAAAAVLPFGAEGLFSFISLIIFGLAIFGIWRAGRETLSDDIAPALMGVVMWVALAALTDHFGSWLATLLPA